MQASDMHILLQLSGWEVVKRELAACDIMQVPMLLIGTSTVPCRHEIG